MSATGVSWVILTRGDRGEALRAPLDSVERSRSSGSSSDVVLVCNGARAGDLDVGPDVRRLELRDNLGVPEGRNVGVVATDGDIIAFLDDDARLITDDVDESIREMFDASPRLGAVSFRIVDEDGRSSRRHIPRIAGRRDTEGGDVVNFLGGACAIRRSAFERAGGYWGELFYAHEELELAWRLHDAGYRVRYVPEIEVFHPRAPISRHSRGWWLTGRNRVLVARRTLPRAVALIHVLSWLVLGVVRAPGRDCRRAYLGGWWRGWTVRVDRRPVRWTTVAQLTRIGRPPII